MPIYPYKCVECGNEFDELYSMKESPLKVRCKICKGLAHRNWNAYGRTDEVMKRNVRYSYSLGCRPWQLEAMRKLHPGAKFVKKGKGYVMEIKNRQEKLQRMKERGYEEYDKGVPETVEPFRYKGD